jgi:hypothetical protein
VFDPEKSGEDYDYFIENFGSAPPVGIGRFDRRLLIERPQVSEWVERDSDEQVTLYAGKIVDDGKAVRFVWGSDRRWTEMVPI